MTSAIPRKFSNLMECKIEEENKKIENRYKNLTGIIDDSSIQKHIGKFYWGDRNLANCGHSTLNSEPKSCSPLLPQLLVTPCLTVDIVPLPPRQFERRYGVTTDQLIKLVDKGFVIPNIYHFYNNCWHDYAKHRHLWPILDHSETRINGEWISAYLDRYFRFSRARERAEALLRDTVPSKFDVVKWLQATGQPEGSLEGLFARFSQQLAYLETLGIRMYAGLDKKVDKIKRRWAEPGQQEEALKLLIAAKNILLSDVTAAYGGRYHMTEAEYEHAHQYAIRSLPLSDLKQAMVIFSNFEEKADLHEKSEFLFSEINRLAEIYPKTNTRDVVSYGAPLDEAEFREYLSVIDMPVVKEGQLAKFSDEIHSHLLRKKETPNISNYKDAIKELDGSIKRFPSWIKASLSGLSQITCAFGAMLQHHPQPSLEGVTLWHSFELATGRLRAWAEKTENRDYIDLSVWGRERRLCRSWARIRTTIAK